LLSEALLKALAAKTAIGSYRRGEKPETTKLRDGYFDEIHRLLEALGALGDPMAVAALSKAMREGGRVTTAMAAARALAAMRVPAAVDPLIEALTLLDNKNLSLPIKGDIAVTLGHIGDRRAVEPLRLLTAELKKEYELHAANKPSPQDATPLARREYEEDLAYIVSCGSVVSKALGMFNG
jgi:HEAT repeat protein